MYKLMKVGDTYNAPKQEFVADEEADVADLPTNVPMGSTCFVIDTTTAYICNSRGEWKQI